MPNYYAQIDNSGLLVGTSMLTSSVNVQSLIPIDQTQFNLLRVNRDKNNIGLFHPKWNGSTWVEGLTPGEIDEIKNSVPPVNPEDEINQLKSDIQTMQETINFLLGL